MEKSVNKPVYALGEETWTQVLVIAKQGETKSLPLWDTLMINKVTLPPHGGKWTH